MNFIREGLANQTVPIIIAGLIVLILIVYSTIRATMDKTIPRMLIDIVLLLGFLSFTYPLGYLMYGLYPVAETIVEGAEAPNSLIWAAIQRSLVSLILGFAVMHISVIAWFVLKRVRTKAIRKVF